MNRRLLLNAHRTTTTTAAPAAQAAPPREGLRMLNRYHTEKLKAARRGALIGCVAKAAGTLQSARISAAAAPCAAVRAAMWRQKLGRAERLG
jgi:hypothetical protein